MPTILKTDAFVLRKKELLRTDMLIYLFTKEIGKTTVIAKGSKSLVSRRGPHLQTGNLLKVMIHVKNDYRYLQQTELVSGFSSIKDDPRKTEYLYLFFFVIDRMLPDNQGCYVYGNSIRYSFAYDFVLLVKANIHPIIGKSGVLYNQYVRLNCYAGNCYSETNIFLRDNGDIYANFIKNGGKFDRPL